MTLLPKEYNEGGWLTLTNHKNAKFQLARLYHEKWTTPAAKVTNGYKTTIAGPNTATLILGAGGTAFDGSLVTSGVGVPDVKKNVLITVTHASAIVALSGVITGTITVGSHSRVVTETWSVTAGGTSKTYASKTAFSTVTSVTVVAATDASADSVIVGTGDVLGLDLRMDLAALLKELSGGSVVTNGTVVAASASANNDPIGTYAPNTIPDGATSYEIVYVTDHPEQT